MMVKGKYPWTSKQLKEAIARCEADVQELIENGADAVLIGDRQHGIDIMRKWLAKAEEQEANE